MSINCKQLRENIIRPTLQTLGLWSVSVENLLLGTCAQESQFGTYIKQIGGPALGIYQIEPATHQDIINNYLSYRNDLFNIVKSFGKIADDSLMTNLTYATAIARIKYLRSPGKIPEAIDIAGLANYWKQYYNTPLGAGTVVEFINNYNKYVS